MFTAKEKFVKEITHSFVKDQDLCRFFCFNFVTDQMGLGNLADHNLWVSFKTLLNYRRLSHRLP